MSFAQVVLLTSVGLHNFKDERSLSNTEYYIGVNNSKDTRVELGFGYPEEEKNMRNG